jgi:SAM-dependent methyltransferase
MRVSGWTLSTNRLAQGGIARSIACVLRSVRSRPFRCPSGPWVLIPWLLAGLWGLTEGLSALAAGAATADRPAYTASTEHDPDGIGKFYLGREIAQVMGHAGISWLERPERQGEERPDLLLPLLKLQPGDVAADVGAGSGYHTRRLARAVGSTGKVYAVDIQSEMLEALGKRMLEAGVTNVVPVLGAESDPHLPPDSLDLVVLVDVYHELAYPYEMMRAICTALKPRGRVALVEFRANDPAVPIKALHTMTEGQARREMAFHPLRWVETVDTLPWQIVIVFEKTGS